MNFFWVLNKYQIKIFKVLKKRNKIHNWGSMHKFQTNIIKQITQIKQTIIKIRINNM